MTDVRYTDPVLTTSGVAARWGTSDTFVYSLMHSGELPAFRVGGKLWRVKLSSVEEYESRGMEAVAAECAAPAIVPAPPIDEVPIAPDFMRDRRLGASMRRLSA
jgi:excisionase family DNA binding protein